jgi:hypothetical protein
MAGLKSKALVLTRALRVYLLIFQLKEISETGSAVYTRPGLFLLRQVDTDSTWLVINNAECG